MQTPDTAVAETAEPKRTRSRSRSATAVAETVEVSVGAADPGKPQRTRRALADAEGLTATGVAVTGNYNSVVTCADGPRPHYEARAVGFSRRIRPRPVASRPGNP